MVGSLEDLVRRTISERIEIARRHRSGLPILFVTGYAENAAIRSNFLGTNMDMITKPFALDALTAKVDEMLIVGQRRSRPNQD